jgi:hypothetical protein
MLLRRERWLILLLLHVDSLGYVYAYIMPDMPVSHQSSLYHSRNYSKADICQYESPS